MPGRKCSLCGGRLDRNNICTECGLDNNKSEKNYKISQGRKKGVRILLIVLVIFCVVKIFKGVVWDVVYRIETKTGMSESEDYEYDPYEFVERELSEDGEPAEYMLESGEYVVGVHIPEGRYRAEAADDFDTVQVDDYQNSIFLYAYAGKEEDDYFEDLRLYAGAHVTINAQDNRTITLTSENAQLSEMHGIENPLTESVEITDKKTWRAGKDLEAGVYDLEVMEGVGQLKLTVYRKDGEMYNSYFTSLDEEGQNVYRNLVIPEDAELSFNYSENVRVLLTPSELIDSSDYLRYYIYYLEEEEE